MTDKLLSGRILKEKIIKSVKNLPPMPQIMHKAREVMGSPDSSFKDLANIIERDQALAIKILKISNSAYYCRRQKISSLQDAAVMLGMRTLGELITIACSSKMLGNTLKGYGFQAGSLWKHSLAVAFGAKIIAKKNFPELSDESFTAGLIHDAGKIILDDFVFERKDTFIDALEDMQKSLSDAEKSVFGFDHSEIAAHICEKWKIPKSITRAIRFHHNPEKIRGDGPASIIYMANQIANWSGMDVDGIMIDSNDLPLEILGINHNEIDGIIDKVVETVEQVTTEL